MADREGLLIVGLSLTGFDGIPDLIDSLATASSITM